MTGRTSRALRAAFRLLGFSALALAALTEHAVLRAIRGPADARARAQWLSRWTKRALVWLRVRIDVHGEVPTHGLIVSNHLGYLDVMVLAAVAAPVFVSKLEVASWPVAGLLANVAGTVYIDRRRMADVVRVGASITPVIAQGQPIAVFLEGKSTAGDVVLPFRPALLEPAVAHDWDVTPTFLRYELPHGGDPAQDVCYWGDHVFVPHLLRLLGQREVRATVVFGPTERATAVAPDRRELAVSLRARVCALAASVGLRGLDRAPEET